MKEEFTGKTHSDFSVSKKIEIKHKVGSAKVTERLSTSLVKKEKRRILYKECKIAGITFRNMGDLWNELYIGGELVLIRHKDNKYDKYAVAVGWSDNYGYPYGIDWDNIIGYIPRTENQHIATMIDLGWADAFECELSQINGNNPYSGSLSMKIYMVSKEEIEVENTSNLIKVLELNKHEYKEFATDITTKGCVYFRWGGFPPWERNHPQKDEKVVFMHKEDDKSILYLMHTIAIGDDEAAFFVTEKFSLYGGVDDCCYYVFTNCKGPIIVKNEDLNFLANENINIIQAEYFLSEEASNKLKKIIGF